LNVPGVDDPARLGAFVVQETTPSYFDVMRTRIVRGRAFVEADGAGAPPVAVVGAAMAQALWGEADPVGRCLHIGPPSAPCTAVVGVAEDALHTGFTGTQPFQFYVPVEQTGGGMGLLLRLRGDPFVDGEAVRRALQPNVTEPSYLRAQPLVEYVDRARRSWALGATLFVAFGLLALAVAAVGFHGLFAFEAAQRMPEFGLRAALGAGRRGLVWLVLGPTLRYAAVGIGAGIALALVARRWIDPLLYQQSASDPGPYVVVAALLVSVAMLASLPPALRAARVDPNLTLRE
jgi:hypothetical protein